jgi:hypothetical protein
VVICCPSMELKQWCSVGLGVAVFSCSCATSVSTPIAVEYWHTGDDGLSQQFQVAVEAAFRRSAEFRLTTVDTRGRRLVVWNIRNVEWEQVGERNKATCTVKFSSLDDNTSRNSNLQQRLTLAKEISVRRVSCWDSEMANCAAQVLSEARLASRKVQQ